MNEIAILISCFNEEMTIGNVIDSFKNQFNNVTICVYDNNSTDDTVKIAREKGAVIAYEHRQGKGNVIRRMFREIDAACYIMIDGDDAFNPTFAVTMYKLVLENSYDMVIGNQHSTNYLIVCSFVFVSSIVSFFAGLILELINKNNKQNF